MGLEFSMKTCQSIKWPMNSWDKTWLIAQKYSFCGSSIFPLDFITSGDFIKKLKLFTTCASTGSDDHGHGVMNY